MISKTAEYALRAVVCLADQADGSMTAQRIAEITRVPSEYLYKVLQALVRAGIVVSQRGLYGGMILARPSAKISVLDVVNSVDPLQRIERCPLGLKSHRRSLCPLHKRLDDALLMIEQLFTRSTIAELLREPSQSRPLCDVEAVARNRKGTLTQRRSKPLDAVGNRPAKDGQS